jgi:hypothetical protein
MGRDRLTSLHTLPLHPSVLEPHFHLREEAEESGDPLSMLMLKVGRVHSRDPSLAAPHCPKALGTETKGRTPTFPVLCLQM